MILPSIDDKLLTARNRYWEQERREEARRNLCTNDMAYLGRPCVCGHHSPYV